MEKLPYHKKTAELIERMCRYVEREDYVLDKKTSEEKLLQTYDLFELPRPKKIVWCKDIFDKKFEKAALSAWSARSALSAWSARSSGSFALDYDFDWFVMEFEYCLNPDSDKLPNENDRKYLKYSELLLEAIEAGLGLRVEWEDTLYLVPIALVKIDELNRFHSDKKPAIRWKDGKEFYYIHGVELEKKWWDKIVNDKMKPSEIFAIDNIEHRRIAYEYMDKSKMKKLKEYKILDEQIDSKGNPMKIISFTVQNMDEPLKFYNCICPSTGREYFLGTDEDTCIEAKNASFGIEDVEFVEEW